MLNLDKNYINGEWINNKAVARFDMINPATEAVYGNISLSDESDVDLAVAAAKEAFRSFRKATKEQRIALIQKIGATLKKRMPDLVDSIINELGAPKKLTEGLHVPAGIMQSNIWSEVLKDFEFEVPHGQNKILRQPIGVCALITSWNYPINGISGVLFPALAAGCTVVWKPSEMASHTAILLLEVLHEAGVPKGVVNLVLGDGKIAGNHLVTHKDVKMVSFTGSAATGTAVAKSISGDVKRLVLELGGKSPYIIFEDADVETSVTDCLSSLFRNTGQTCTAPSRLLVHKSVLEQTKAIAKKIAENITVGDPGSDTTAVGPLGNEGQWLNVQNFIQRGIEDGNQLLAGGLGSPENLENGFYVKPTVFTSDDNQTYIAQHEAFGPVLVIIPFDTDEQAIQMANDNEGGLSAFLCGSTTRVEAAARDIEAGMVHLNQAGIDLSMPFGGVKRSGVGRKLGIEGLMEYLEPKSIYR